MREESLRSPFGDVTPLRVFAGGDVNRTFVYPQGAGDPGAEAVRRSFTLTSDGYRSVLGRVAGTTYAGRTAAGGFGRTIDVDGDGRPDARFSSECGFLLQLRHREVIAVEADRGVTAVIRGKRIAREAHAPVMLHMSTRVP